MSDGEPRGAGAESRRWQRRARAGSPPPAPFPCSRSKEHVNIVKSFLKIKRKNKAKLYPWLPDGWEQSLCKAEEDSGDLDPEQAERFWTQPALWSASEMFGSFHRWERGVGVRRHAGGSSFPAMAHDVGT